MIRLMQKIVQPDLNMDSVHPLNICLSCSLTTEHNIHFFKGQSFGFWHEEPNEEASDAGHNSEEEICAIT